MVIKKKIIFSYLSFYCSFFFLGSLIFFFLLRLDIFTSEKLFFDALKSLFLSCLIIIVLFYWKLRKNKFFKFIQKKDIIISILIFLFLHYTVYGLIPFNVSRSVSIITMGYFLKNKENYLTKEQVSNYVNKIYFKESQAVQKRLDEQVYLGHLKITNGKYKITNKGIYIIKLMGTISTFYNIKKNYAIINK